MLHSFVTFFLLCLNVSLYHLNGHMLTGHKDNPHVGLEIYQNDLWKGQQQSEKYNNYQWSMRKWERIQGQQKGLKSYIKKKRWCQCKRWCHKTTVSAPRMPTQCEKRIRPRVRTYCALYHKGSTFVDCQVEDCVIIWFFSACAETGRYWRYPVPGRGPAMRYSS